MSAIYTKMTAIGDAIRTKTGGTEKLSLDEMASKLNNIKERNSSDLSANGATVIAPAGNYKENASLKLETKTLSKPSIVVNAKGLITASIEQEAGYIEAGTQSNTKQMTTQAAQTITPGTSNKTIASGTYLTGTQTIKGDANLVAENIVSGKSIFGITGSFSAENATLNFKVIGGTTKPTSPVENTIWVNTDVAITSWDFSNSTPERRSRNKNLIVYPYDTSTSTINGITFTTSSNGTVTANGTATAAATFWLHDNNGNGLSLPAGSYYLSGAPNNGSSSTYITALKYSYDNWATASYISTGNTPAGRVVTFTEPVQLKAYLQVKSGVTCNNIVFSPQLEKGTSATSFTVGSAAGQIWISTGKSSVNPFNALKDNNLQVYPLEVYQYHGYVWNKKTALIYQKQTWTDLVQELFLFNSGNTCSDITGGWTASGQGSIGSASLDIASGTSGPALIDAAQVITNNAINFSGYNTLHVNVNKYHSPGKISFSTTKSGNAVASTSVSRAKEYTIDIRNYNNSYFVKLRTEEKQNNDIEWLDIGFYANKVWLTRD